MRLPRQAREPPAPRMPAPEHPPGSASPNTGAGDATLIYSGTLEWNAWVDRYAATWPKQHDAMMHALAAVTRARARWLLQLLLEIFSSDIASEDVTIDQSQQRTAVLIRGAVVREFTMRAMFAVPSPMPPIAAPQQLRQIGGEPPKPAAPEPAPVRIAARPRVRQIGGARPVPGMPMIFEHEGREIITSDGKNPFPPEHVIVDGEPIDKKTLAVRNAAEFETTRHRRAGLAMEEAILAKALEDVKSNLVPDVEASELLDTILTVDPHEAFDQELIGPGPTMKTPRKDVPLRRRVINIRDDVIGRMAKRKQLHDVNPPAALAALCGRRKDLESALDGLPVIDRQTPSGEGKRIDRRRRQIDDELAGVKAEIAEIQDADNARMEEQKQTCLNAARFYEKHYLAAQIGGARAIDPFREVVDGGRFIMPDTDIRLTAQRRLAKIDKALGPDAVHLVRLVIVEKWEIGQIAEAQGDDSTRGRRRLQAQLRDALEKISRFMPETPRPASFRSARDVYASLSVLASNVNAHGVLLAAIEAARIK